MKVEPCTIKVPASSANLGPGFDVLGLGLNRYLEIELQASTSGSGVKIAYEGDEKEGGPVVWKDNLITQMTEYVLNCEGGETLEGKDLTLVIRNAIPFGRGLGSSAAAVVGGVALGSVLGGYDLSRERMKDYCLMIERHPDNITAALEGGLCSSFLRDLTADEEFKSETAEAILKSQRHPPLRLATSVQYRLHHDIGIVVGIPTSFKLATEKARGALPDTYSRGDVVYNLQRLAVLAQALTQTPDAHLISSSIKDRVHQPYRQSLVPGLQEILELDNIEGLLGTCLSGAGPTVLAFVDKRVRDVSENVGTALQRIWKENGIEASYLTLDVDATGLSIA